MGLSIPFPAADGGSRTVAGCPDVLRDAEPAHSWQGRPAKASGRWGSLSGV